MKGLAEWTGHSRKCPTIQPYQALTRPDTRLNVSKGGSNVRSIAGSTYLRKAQAAERKRLARFIGRLSRPQPPAQLRQRTQGATLGLPTSPPSKSLSIGSARALKVHKLAEFLDQAA